MVEGKLHRKLFFGVSLETLLLKYLHYAFQYIIEGVPTYQ